jgi:uncharacterized FlaG/YvyC family protein
MDNIETDIEHKMRMKYDTTNNKIKKLNNQNRHNSNNANQHIFFKRVENMTDISFTNKELDHLNKGLKYNLHSKPKTWIKTVALEADTVIRLIPQENQAYMRQLVANNIK